ncbi:MAG: Crp/Fnr family transcriptional regulator [Pseudomonadota bacterium]
MPKDFQKLRRVNIFSALAPKTLDSLASATREVSSKKGAVIFSKGDTPRAAFLVLHGEIAVECISNAGHAARIATLGPGDLLGELAVLGDIKRTADARAISDCVLLRIDAAVFRSMISKDESFAQSIISVLVARISSSNIQIECLATLSLRARLASLLINFVETEDQAIMRVTQSELADRLSATREKVNQHLRALHRTGSILLSRGRIEIIDRDALLDEIANI